MGEDFFPIMSERGGGPSNTDRRELASAMIKERHAHDSQGERGRRLWGARKGGRRTRVGVVTLWGWRAWQQINYNNCDVNG